MDKNGTLFLQNKFLVDPNQKVPFLVLVKLGFSTRKIFGRRSIYPIARLHPNLGIYFSVVERLPTFSEFLQAEYKQKPRQG